MADVHLALDADFERINEIRQAHGRKPLTVRPKSGTLEYQIHRALKACSPYRVIEFEEDPDDPDCLCMVGIKMGEYVVPTGSAEVFKWVKFS